MHKLLLPAALALLLSTPAAFAQSAQDGFYAGATGNFSLGISEAKAPGASENDYRGLGAGAFVGWGTGLDFFYLGVEGGLEYGDLNVSGNAGGTPYTASRRETVSAAARVGFTPSEESLLYLSGGLSLANWTVEDGSTSSQWVSSYKVGVGAEQAIDENMFARLSYDIELPRETTDFGPVGLELTTSTAKIGLGLRF